MRVGLISSMPALLLLNFVVGYAPPAWSDYGESAIIIFDTSGSMRWNGQSVGPAIFRPGGSARLTDTRMEPPTRFSHAIEVANETVERFRKQRYDMGLVVFGQGDCKTIDLMVQLGGPDPAGSIRKTVAGLQPRGLTPLAASIERTSEYIRNSGYKVREVVLITDGIDTCGGDVKKAAQGLAKLGVKLNITGLDIPADQGQQLEDLAGLTGGAYTPQAAVGYGGGFSEQGACGPCAAAYDARIKALMGTGGTGPLPEQGPAAAPPKVFVPPGGGLFPDDDANRMKQ